MPESLAAKSMSPATWSAALPMSPASAKAQNVQVAQSDICEIHVLCNTNSDKEKRVKEFL